MKRPGVVMKIYPSVTLQGGYFLTQGAFHICRAIGRKAGITKVGRNGQYYRVTFKLVKKPKGAEF